MGRTRIRAPKGHREHFPRMLRKNVIKELGSDTAKTSGLETSWATIFRKSRREQRVKLKGRRIMRKMVKSPDVRFLPS